MERYSFEQAKSEAEKIREKATEIKGKRLSNKESDSEPTGEDYENAEKCLVFSEHESVKIKEWAMRLVKSWHDEIKPDYIFFTETSAIPHGYVLKETWKNAYPDEIAPITYRINPSAEIVKGSYSEEGQAAERAFVSKRIKKDNPRIIVFDEGQIPTGMGAIAVFSTDGVRNKSPLDAWPALYIDSIAKAEPILNKLGLTIEEFEKLNTTSPATSSGKAASFLLKVLTSIESKPSIWTSRQTGQKEADPGEVIGVYIDAPKNYKPQIDYIRLKEPVKHLIITQKEGKRSSRRGRETGKRFTAYRSGLPEDNLIGRTIKGEEGEKEKNCRIYQRIERTRERGG